MNANSEPALTVDDGARENDAGLLVAGGEDVAAMVSVVREPRNVVPATAIAVLPPGCPVNDVDQGVPGQTGSPAEMSPTAQAREYSEGSFQHRLVEGVSQSSERLQTRVREVDRWHEQQPTSNGVLQHRLRLGDRHALLAAQSGERVGDLR